jgi:hypothetical protein
VLVVAAPIAALVLAAAGLLVARRRSWAVIAGGVGGLVTVGLVAVLVQSGRREAVDQLSGGILGRAAAGAVVDHVSSAIDQLLVATAAVSVVIVVVGALAAAVGSSRRV